jgi:hypothetical protein
MPAYDVPPMRRLEACRGGTGQSGPARRTFRGAGRQPDAACRMAVPWLGVAPSIQHSIPLLTGIPNEYQLQDGIQVAAHLAKSLLLADIADPALWARSRQSPFTFVELAIQQWLAEHGSETIRGEFAVNAVLTQSLDPYGTERDPALPCEEMYLLLEPDSAAYVILGPTLTRLEAVHPRLPATFFHLLTGSLNRWLRVYDYRDAEDRVEQLREWYESDPDGENVELPAIDRTTPATVRRRPLAHRRLARLMDTCADDEVLSLMQAVVELDRTSVKAARPELTPEAQEGLMDCNPPLPSLLAVFDPHDAVEGCFDDESQGMLECTPEPNTILPFRIADIDGVRSAFRTLGVICDTLTHASRLISRIMATEVERSGGHSGPAS